MQMCVCVLFFFQAEDGIRDLVRSRGLGDVYKRQREDRGRAGNGIRDVMEHSPFLCPASLAFERVRISLSLIHI